MLKRLLQTAGVHVEKVTVFIDGYYDVSN